MRRIVVTEFVSLDGVMEEPRWTFDFDRGKEGDQFILGPGKRVFPDSMPAPAKLTLTDSRTVGSGVLLLNLTPDQK